MVSGTEAMLQMAGGVSSFEVGVGAGVVGEAVVVLF
jgi:hypothetical protein